MKHTSEYFRLLANENGTNWKKFGPYLAERQWGTVREDYSEYGAAWEAFTHDEARSRVYRWGEDGLMGISDEKQLICFAFAFWNGKDSILKERLFGLTGNQGNHSEDVKEYYYYLASNPTHSYMKMAYHYPHAAFPYSKLIQENENRDKSSAEFELVDTQLFDKNDFFIIEVEYVKNTPDDILIQISIENKANIAAHLDVLPTIWFRNTWNWTKNAYKPHLEAHDATIIATHEKLGRYFLHTEVAYPLLFTENETNATRLYGLASNSPFVKDAFHEYVVENRKNAVNPSLTGTKAACYISLEFEKFEKKTIKLRLSNDKNLYNERENLNPFTDFDAIFNQRKSDFEVFYESIFKPENLDLGKQLMGGMMWGKQYYEFNVKKWLDGDATQFPPPDSRKKGRNATWKHIDNHDIISMPDKWEYPWYAAWDSAFHCIAIAKCDVFFAKQQLLMFLSDRYMNDFGQIPAYEWAFGDVNPPVLSLGIWEVYQIDKYQHNKSDFSFLHQAFERLQINFQWWLNTQSKNQRMIFGGGFLGLDNVAVIDRGKPLPDGFWLEQVDGTVWMARFALDMLKISLELACNDEKYVEKAIYYTKIFLKIAVEINHPQTGLWNSKTEFYHDKITNWQNNFTFLDHKNIVGLLPLIATDVIDNNHSSTEKYFDLLNNFLNKNTEYNDFVKDIGKNKIYFSVIPERNFFKISHCLFDKNDFMGNFGIRSLSIQYNKIPFKIELFGQKYEMKYRSGESDTTSFGENSNWRGPVWLPVNYVILQSLVSHAQYYGNDLMDKRNEIIAKLLNLFFPKMNGSLPIYSGTKIENMPEFNQKPLFYEFFDPETGRGCGASHQTGWTGMLVSLM